MTPLSSEIVLSLLNYRITMNSKFFNNDNGDTLFDKLKGIATEMDDFDRFLAVVGFFLSSGYLNCVRKLVV